MFPSISSVMAQTANIPNSFLLPFCHLAMPQVHTIRFSHNHRLHFFSAYVIVRCKFINEHQCNLTKKKKRKSHCVSVQIHLHSGQGLFSFFSMMIPESRSKSGSFYHHVYPCTSQMTKKHPPVINSITISHFLRDMILSCDLFMNVTSLLIYLYFKIV